jgi:nitrogen regulatory protein P-II 1
MKLIIAVIQPERLENVMQELDNNQVYLRTVSQALGVGRQKGHSEIYRGTREVVNLLKKVRLEIAVNEDFVEKTIDAIVRGARTGNIGDGKIFVLDLPECVRIRTGERGNIAIG